MDLNTQQQKGATHKKGPLLIIAGAGTGKTTVITERIKYLIKEKKANPQEILALTFTQKASQEMLERLDVVMPLGYEEPWLSTFHAFCDRVLKTEGLEIGLSPDYKILTAPDQWLLMKKHLFDFRLDYYRPLGNPTKFIGAILKFFSRIKDEDINEKEIENFLKKQKNKDSFKKYKELLSAFKKYEKIKLQENVLDFGDLVIWTLKLFRERRVVLKKYQNQFKYILVDEFQDTNFAQLQLIKILAPADKNPNLTVVGDDDQSIYKWRGAAVSNILDFKKHYPKAHQIILSKNYRSGQKLLDKAYSLIQGNNPDRLEKKLKINKKLKAQRQKNLLEPKVIELLNLEAESEFVAEQILELVGVKSYTYKDFAILARANNHLDPFVSALKRKGIPYQLLGNRGLFDQEEVKSLIFFLRAVGNPTNQTNLFQLASVDIFKTEPELILNLLSESRKKRKNLWEVICQNHKSLFNLVNQIKKARKKATSQGTLKILYDFIEETGYVKELVKEESIENSLKLKNLNLFLEKIKKFEAENKDSNLIEFIDFLDLVIEAGENPAQAEIEDIDTVNLLTVHSAKGLEFKVVFLINCVSDRFPTRRRGDPIEFPEELIKETLPKGDSHIQEERRLFYVALTRTRDYFFAIFAKDYGGVREKNPSGFLKELGVETEKPEKIGNITKQLSWLEETKKGSFKKPKTLSSKVNLQYLSYSQIDIFKTCPLKYKYSYILAVPKKPHHALAFGQTIHEVLRDFHRFEQKGQKPDLKTLLYFYKNYFKVEGYESEKHKEERRKKGRKMLKNYFAVYKEKFLGKPKFLEKPFRIKIGNIPLIGKIDRIDELKKGFELIDYKTGSIKDQKTVDKDAQLTIYALAAREVFGIEPETLSLYFIEENQKLETARSKEQIRAKKEEILKTVEDIKKSNFLPKPNFPFPCGYCGYSLICPFAKKP